MKTHPIPDEALNADIAILGKKGRGKTFTAKGCVERLLDMGRRVVVLDPLSTWWGLKAGDAGYPIAVIGGPHGDLPLNEKDGAALGRFFAGSDSSVVIDVGQMRKGELVRFATSFLEELYTANRDPLWLVLEEADVFAPQQPMPDTTRLLGEVDRIARRGRQYGFRLITLTQRPAKLNKDVLTQLSTLVALGVTSPQDRDAIKAWVEGNADRDRAKAVVESLASLKVGEGWVWAPDLDLLERVKFPPIKTLDTSATPQAGAPRAPVPVRKDVDVAAIKAVLAAERVESRAEVAADPDALAAAEARGYERGLAAGRKEGRAEVVTAALDGLRGLGEEIAALGTGADAAQPAAAPAIIAAPAPARAPAAASAPRPRAKDRAAPAAGALTGPQFQFLKALAWWKAMGHPAPSRAQVAAIAGWRVTSGHLKNVAGSLSSAGLITYPQPGTFAFTTTGEAAAPRPDLSATLLDSLRATLTGPQRAAVDVLLRHRRGIARGELATKCGWEPTSGHVKNVIGSLSTLEIVTYPSPGIVALQEWVK